MIWKDYKYLCSKNCDNKRLPQKNCWVGGGARPKMPPTPYGERDPPHGENGPYVERKSPPPPYGIFFIHAPPPGRSPTPPPPLRALVLTSTNFIPLTMTMKMKILYLT